MIKFMNSDGEVVIAMVEWVCSIKVKVNSGMAVLYMVNGQRHTVGLAELTEQWVSIKNMLDKEV